MFYNILQNNEHSTAKTKTQQPQLGGFGCFFFGLESDSVVGTYDTYVYVTVLRANLAQSCVKRSIWATLPPLGLVLGECCSCVSACK